MRIYTFIFFISLLIFSCDPQYKHESGELPSTPQNLADFNTSHDDYNSTAPTLGSFIPLCFSTNRYSNGSQFDVIYEPLVVSFGKSTGIFRILNSYAEWGINKHYDDIFHNALKKITTSANELGPYFMVNRTMAYQGYEYLLMYASDEAGNFDIRFTFKREQDSLFMESMPIEYINSEFDDLYPFVDIDKGQFLFCSNRENDRFDIYTIEIDDPYMLNEVNDKIIQASLYDRKSQRHLDIYTTYPTIVCYTDNFPMTYPLKYGVENITHMGVCFEAQNPPNGICLEDIESSILLPADEYHHSIRYVFSIKK